MLGPAITQIIDLLLAAESTARKSRVEPEATAPALTALLAGRSLGAARASGDADGAPQC